MISYTVGERSILFVETKRFTERLPELLDEETYHKLQNELARNPAKGAVIRGCGGLRTVRVEELHRHKGRRGGCRVIYLHVPEAARIDLLAIYSKDVQDDLTAEQRNVLKAMAERARKEAMASKHDQKD